eukprot:322311_1
MAQRQKYLSFGFVRQFEMETNILIPIEIKHLCQQYISDQSIFSSTELQWKTLSEKRPLIRIMVMGPANVGKSALTLRLVTGKFHAETDPTIEDSYRKEITVCNIPQKLDILDTCSMGFDPVRDVDGWYDVETHLMNGNDYGPDILMIVYAINNDKYGSYNSLQEWMNEHCRRILMCYTYKQPIAIILIGNKMDLPDTDRTITYEQAVQIANELKGRIMNHMEENGSIIDGHWNIPIIETSAKTNENVFQAFELALKTFKNCYECKYVKNNRKIRKKREKHVSFLAL